MASTYKTLVVGAVVVVIVGAVWRSVAKDNNPRLVLAVLRFVGLGKVPLQPLVLLHYRHQAVLHVEPQLCGDGHKVDRSHVEAVVHLLVLVTRHVEPVPGTV